MTYHPNSNRRDRSKLAALAFAGIAAVVAGCLGASAAQAANPTRITPRSVSIQTADQAIYGLNTGLVNPYGFTMDDTGKMYVANMGDGTPRVFARNAVGDVPPITQTDFCVAWPAGPCTGQESTYAYLGAVHSLAVDRFYRLWGSDPAANKIYVFENLQPPVNGVYAPLTVIGMFDVPYRPQAIGIRTLSDGNTQELVIVSADQTGNSGPSSVSTYALPTPAIPAPPNGFSGHSISDWPGTALPSRLGVMDGAGPFTATQVSFDADGNVLVGGDADNVYLLPRLGSGTIGTANAMPLRTLTGNSGGRVGAAFTSDGRIVTTSFVETGIGLRLWSADAATSSPIATFEVSTATRTNSPVAVAVTSDGATAKFSAIGSAAVGAIALTVPTPSPSPSNDSGGDGGGASNESATPTPTSTSTPTPTPTPTVVPTVTASASPSPSVTAPAGVVLLSGTERASAQVVTVTAPVSTSAATAPEVTVTTGTAVSPVVSGLPPSTPLQAGMSVSPLTRAKTSFVSIGTTRSTANGRAKVPAFKASRAGIYTIRLTTPAGKAFYLKVKVAPKKSSSASGSSAKASGKSSR